MSYGGIKLKEVKHLDLYIKHPSISLQSKITLGDLHRPKSVFFIFDNLRTCGLPLPELGSLEVGVHTS